MRTAVANRSGAVRNVWSERFSGRRSGGVRRFFERSHHEDGIAVVGGGTGIGGDFIIRKRAGARRQLWRRAKRRHRVFLRHGRLLRQHGLPGRFLGFSDRLLPGLFRGRVVSRTVLLSLLARRLLLLDSRRLAARRMEGRQAGRCLRRPLWTARGLRLLRRQRIHLARHVAFELLPPSPPPPRSRRRSWPRSAPPRRSWPRHWGSRRRSWRRLESRRRPQSAVRRIVG